MICQTEPINEKQIRCRNCGRIVPAIPRGAVLYMPCGDTPVEQFQREVEQARASRRVACAKGPAGGPGTELTKLFASLGIVPKANCPCRKLAEEMDRLGVSGCRRERDRIIAKLREHREHFGLADTAKAATLAFATGLAFKISWSDPIPDLFDLAVSRAEENPFQE